MELEYIKEVEENNKIIAEFMGYTWKIDEEYHSYSYWINQNDNTLNHLYYHCDWNWLMKVIEKIADTRIKEGDCGYKVEVTNGYTQISGTGEKIFSNACMLGSMLLATHRSVVKFIIWYKINSKNI